MPSPEQSRRGQQYTLGQDARREIGDMYSWYRRHLEGGGNLPAEPFTKFGPRTVRIARTTTNAEFPTYPSYPANTFVVEFGKTLFPPFPGLRLLTFTPYDPEEKRIAHDINCTYYEEGTIVVIELVHDQWYIIGGNQAVLATATLSADLCNTGSASVSSAQLLPTCADFTPTTVTNPRNHGGKNGHKVLMIKKACLSGSGSTLEKCAAATEEWEIFDVEQRKYCTVVGIEDRESCLVAAGLQLRGEWCPNDEPIAACAVVTYTDCDTQLPTCDTDWTFAPLYACCGQGQSGGGGGGGGGSPLLLGGGSPGGTGGAPGAVPGRFVKP